MARPLRVEFEDAIYHLCLRGNARQEIQATGQPPSFLCEREI